MPILPSPTSLVLALAAAALAGPASADGQCPPVHKYAEGTLSTERWEWRLSFTPSRQRAYWSTTAGWWPGTRERATILTSRRSPWGWGEPEVAPFSGLHSDMDPYVSPDGRVVVFSSERPRPDGSAGKMDLWQVRRTARGWSQPAYLGDAVNSAGDELYASTDRHGTLYFGSDREGEWNIYRSRRLRDGRYGPAEKLGPGVNSAQRWEFNPEISPDGRTLVFTRLDFPNDALPDLGHGWGDLYVSRLRRDGFGAARNLGPCVNTAWDEFHPTVLWERDLLFYARDVGRPSDFYVTRLPLPEADE
ncbi:PD40 domain-containing protein [Vulcaniibacterium tengchongense]|uniref:WD40 repeat protein n=1 Tax=Vulcaniibacterium tengchongense TaxID=1273429 RepID=A0A3N4VN97_9GAMM|nr:PD40 domain-containing protein [Vulcaniibacterium tengchongense]RPE81309.1 WD40 repeat protein [Vulcaniibacterium tengchongense]